MSKMFYTRCGNTTLINFEDARIIHRNLSGKVSRYNRDGNRNFSLVLEPEQAEELSKQGFNVRRKGPDEDPFFYMAIAVNYNSLYPPDIRRIINGEKVMTTLDEKTVGSLDYSNILSVDLTINPRPWTINGESGVKGYCKTMFVTVEEDAFGKKYMDYLTK